LRYFCHVKNLLLLVFLICGFHVFSQDKSVHEIDANVFYGSILLHNKDISHLIKGHPTGVILSYNRKTFGANSWESRYNYPDWGFSFAYQDMKSEELGNNFGVYGHYNFYFLKRNLMLRVGQGIAYNTNPFNLEDNFRNRAYGSHLLSSTYLMLNYKSKPFWGGFGIQSGIAVIHYSNASIKSPNTSTNSLTFNVGATYTFNEEDVPNFVPKVKEKYTEPLKLNFAFRTGFNEGDEVGHGTYPFYIFSAYVDKVLNRKSRLVLGTELFISKFLEEEIKYQSIAFPNQATGDEDYKRAGVFIGHELKFARYSAITHAGYYYYYPYDFEGPVYFRLGLKRTFGKHIFGVISVKSHGAKAEALEFSLGYRL